MFRLLLAFLVILTPAVAAAQSILVLGDSLSAGYGVPEGRGWVALMRQRVEQRLPGTEVINASISGETTQGGLTRLPALLSRHKPDLVVVELGANDGLRGTPLPLIRQNLLQLIRLSQDAGARVLLIGMRLPPNYGPRYTDGFHKLFADVAQARQVPDVPFLMDGVALDRSLLQSDGLHPTEAAQPRLLENVWPYLEPLLVPGKSQAGG